MASSRKSQRSELCARVGAVLAVHVPAGARLTLGLSGGIDSIVLLDLLAQLAPQHPFRLCCLHVHHGLSAHADAWAAFAQARAARAGCVCDVRRVQVDVGPGLGLEAAARAARYAAFAACAADFVVLAHQRDDQAETLLLQLVRGAGVAGLAAMPVVRALHAAREARESGARHPGVQLLRPMLDVGRDEIETYARARGLAWVEDDSNVDTVLARNRVRLQVMPLLRALNPAAAANIARSAAHLGDALALVEAVAAQDLRAVQHAEALDLGALRALGEVRACNVLRAWFAQHGIGAPATARLREVLRQLLDAEGAAAPAARFGAWRLHRHGDRAWLVAAAVAPRVDFEVRWMGESPWRLPELGGALHFTPAVGTGIAAAAVQPACLSVRLRRGGERFRPDARRPRRALKKLLQEHGVAPWARARLPLLYCDGELAFVPGIGVAHALQPARDEAGVVVRWIADTTAA